MIDSAKYNPRLPFTGTRNPQIEIAIATASPIILMIPNGSNLAPINSQGRVGVTMTCSSVPLSFSRTMAEEPRIMGSKMTSKATMVTMIKLV